MKSKKSFIICIILLVINTILAIVMGFIRGCLGGCDFEFILLQFVGIYVAVLVPNFMCLLILYYSKNLWSNIVYIVCIVITIVSQILSWIIIYQNKFDILLGYVIILWWITFLLPMIIFFVLLIMHGLQQIYKRKK